jgi:hypothetical protein
MGFRGSALVISRLKATPQVVDIDLGFQSHHRASRIVRGM